jgi:hypothetical protein
MLHLKNQTFRAWQYIYVGVFSHTDTDNPTTVFTQVFFDSCFILSTMDDKIEQHICSKFCMKLIKSVSKSLELLREAFGEHSLCWTADFERHPHFKASRMSLEDDEHSKRPGTSKTRENVEIFENLSTKTITKLTNTVGIRYRVCQ